MKLSQTELERLVFKKFLKHTDLNVIRFQSCKPPKPDILCEHQCGKLYFELTDNTSEEIQKSIHEKNEQIRKKRIGFLLSLKAIDRNLGLSR